MSNLIKASQISYKEEIRAIDMNERAQEVEARYLDSYIANNIVAKQISFSDVAEQLNRESALLENPEEENGDGFSEGIPAKKRLKDVRIFALGRNEKRAGERFIKYWKDEDFFFVEGDINNGIVIPKEQKIDR